MNSAEIENPKARKLKKYNAYLIIILSLFIFFLCTNGYISELTTGYKSLLYDWLGKKNKWTSSFGSAAVDNYMDHLSAFSGQLFLSIFSALFGGYLFLRKKYRTLYTYFIVVIGAGIFHVILKNSFAGEPWYKWLNVFNTEDTGFPSGHALMSVVFYFTIARLIYRSDPDHKINNYLMTIALLLSISIGLAQVIRGAHTPTDVVAGWSVGFAWISAAWLLDHHIRKRIFLKHHIRESGSTET